MLYLDKTLDVRCPLIDIATTWGTLALIPEMNCLD
jgi:hypothetical protein